jgi:hypothetical protein
MVVLVPVVDGEKPKKHGERDEWKTLQSCTTKVGQSIHSVDRTV